MVAPVGPAWTLTGYDATLGFLSRAHAQGRLPHAILVVGPPGVGKGTLARDLARLVNCRGNPPPCGECTPCRRIASDRCVDVLTVSRERPLETGGEEGQEEARQRKNISIGDVRAIQRLCALRPYEVGTRVFILDGAEHLSPDAADALLKSLEEPPPGVVFVLLASREEAIPPTVRSRCHRIALHPLPEEVLQRELVARAGLEPPRARLLARLAGGRLGWALRLATEEGLLRGREEAVEEAGAMVTAPLEARLGVASQLAQRFAEGRGAVEERLALWAGWWRDLLLVKEGLAEQATNQDRLPLLREQASRLSRGQIIEGARLLLATLEALRLNASPRLALEGLVLSLPRPSPQ